MAKFTLHGANDVARTRNIMRKLLIAQLCDPTLTTRSWLAVTLVTEKYFTTGNPVHLDVAVVLKAPSKAPSKRIVELSCTVPLFEAQSVQNQELEGFLARTVNALTIDNRGNQLLIQMQLW